MLFAYAGGLNLACNGESEITFLEHLQAAAADDINTNTFAPVMYTMNRTRLIKRFVMK